MKRRPPVDLRSDTVTRPTEAMRSAIASAEVGDDVFGEDPTVRRLQETAARALGQEAALFVPSGTMANLIAVMTHCHPGDEAICGCNAHTFAYEAGGAAAVAGVTLRVLGTAGHFDAAALADAIHLPDPSGHVPATRLVIVENTHNRGGGRIMAPLALKAIAEVCNERGVALHLDGARLFNAAVALDVSVAEWGKVAHSTSFCLSKGLGCPAGSLLVGPLSFIKRAHRARKMLGGGMRQVGVLAAAGLHAFEHHVERLADDHRRAKTLAEGLAALPGIELDPAQVETNIVIFSLGDGAPPARDVCGRVASEALVLPIGGQSIRAVTHLDVDDEGIERALKAFRAALR